MPSHVQIWKLCPDVSSRCPEQCIGSTRSQVQVTAATKLEFEYFLLQISDHAVVFAACAGRTLPVLAISAGHHFLCCIDVCVAMCAVRPCPAVNSLEAPLQESAVAATCRFAIYLRLAPLPSEFCTSCAKIWACQQEQQEQHRCGSTRRLNAMSAHLRVRGESVLYLYLS